MLLPLLLLRTIFVASDADSGRAPSSAAFMRSPDIHGDEVAYTCEGDIWLGDLKTGRAIRLTRDVGTEMNARFSPDGSMLAYDGELDGVREIYVMPVAGGVPKRLTYLNEGVDCVDWKDGHTVVFRSHNPAYTAPTLMTVDVNGGEAQSLPLEFASCATFAPDGNRFVFTRYQRFTNAWFRYAGGLKNPIWLGDLKSLSFKQIHEGAGSCEFPTWAGDRVYFTTQENGSWYLASVKADGSSAKKETTGSDVELRYLQTDGKRLIYERGLGCEIFDPATSAAKPVQFEMVSDYLHTRPFMVPAETAVHSVSVGPTGKRVLVETRGQIISLPVKDGDARVVLAKDGVRFRYPVYSPNGKKIAYLSDESGEMQVCVCDPDGSNQKTLTGGANRDLQRISWSPDSTEIAYTTNEGAIHLVSASGGADRVAYTGAVISYGAADFDWSPDSKWLLVDDLDLWTGFRTMELIEVSTGKITRLGQGMVDDFSPRFSKDGKYIAFLSRRNLQPTGDPIQNHMDLNKDVKAYILTLSKDEPSPLRAKEEDEGEAPSPASSPETSHPGGNVPATKIDLDGLYGRFVELPIPPGSYDRLEFADGRVLVRESTLNQISFFDLKTRKPGTLTGGMPTLQLSADGKHILVVGGPEIYVMDSTGENNAHVAYAGLQLRIDPKAEWKEMYWDAWRHIRDYFYVANMHGANWKAIGEKYAAMLPSVRSRDELDLLIRWIQGELSISHSFLNTGDVRSVVRPARPSFLGADLEPGQNGYYRIQHIFRGGDFEASERSPLAEPGLNVKEGEYLISVAGVPAKPGSPWREALLGRAGQLVTIKVNTIPEDAGARSVEVKPIASEARMRLWDWVQQRKRYVDQASGGKLAYVYLRAMTAPDMADFIRQYFPQRNKQGLIVDVRFNTGGFVSDYIITILKQKGLAFWNQRNTSVPWTRQADFFPGPMVCLENEFNYSDGEEFPFYFKAMKLGPVIGRRTRGGEVGSDPGWVLADGGSINVPNYGMFTPEQGWVIEGHGVDPDIEVLSDPNAWARGKDPQLDRAIQVLTDQIAKNPFKIPTFPPDPIHVKSS